MKTSDEVVKLVHSLMNDKNNYTAKIQAKALVEEYAKARAGHVDTIVIGDPLATSSNVIRFLSAFNHGLATGKRVDLLEADFQNAKDHFDILTDIVENRQ